VFSTRACVGCASRAVGVFSFVPGHAHHFVSLIAFVSSLSVAMLAGRWVAAVHPDWQRVDEMRKKVMEYFRARKEDQPLKADELLRRPCTAVEERLEVCQWLEELRAL
jgi:hypothetical protein